LQVVDQPTQLLQQIKTSAIDQGTSVKNQITQTVNTFQGSTSDIKQMVSGQLVDIKAKYQEPARTYDGYRWVLSLFVLHNHTPMQRGMLAQHCSPAGPALESVPAGQTGHSVPCQHPHSESEELSV
jgi:hypothetical protein